MERLRRRRAKAGKQTEPTTLSRRDKLLIIGAVIAVLSAIFAFEHFYWTRNAADHLEQLLGSWTTRYHLNNERAHSLLLRQTMGLEAQPSANVPALESR